MQNMFFTSLIWSIFFKFLLYREVLKFQSYQIFGWKFIRRIPRQTYHSRQKPELLFQIKVYYRWRQKNYPHQFSDYLKKIILPKKKSSNSRNCWFGTEGSYRFFLILHHKFFDKKKSRLISLRPKFKLAEPRIGKNPNYVFFIKLYYIWPQKNDPHQFSYYFKKIIFLKKHSWSKLSIWQWGPLSILLKFTP